MGSKSKLFLKEEAVPTAFSFAPEPARKRRESSISRAGKRVKKLCIEEGISSHEAGSSHTYKVDLQELELTSEKCIGTEPVITVDKVVGKHTATKSVRSQYNPLYVLNALETTETCKNDLKVKWPTSKRREKMVNADFKFQPNTKVQFVSPEVSAVASDEFSDTELDPTIDNESDQPYNLKKTSESDYSSDTSKQSDKSLENTFLKEPKYLVFWSSLLLLFRYCFTCKEKTKILSVRRSRGTLLVVTMKCHNKHIYTWRSQPMVNNTGSGNIILSGAILYTGNTFKRISDTFDSINIPHFSRALFYNIQKTLLFPTLNSFYKRYRSKIINICTTREENNFIGNGRSDSPGYSAKYGTYSLMSTDLNKIVDFFLVHISMAGNSSRMEKKGLQTLLGKYPNSIKVTTLTTGQHVQIRSFLSREYPEMLHQFDVCGTLEIS